MAIHRRVINYACDQMRVFKCELPVPVAFPRLHDYEVFSHGQQPEIESLLLSLRLLTMKGLEFGIFNKKN